MSCRSENHLSFCYRGNRPAHIQDPVLDSEAEPEVQVEPRLRPSRLPVSSGGGGHSTVEHRDRRFELPKQQLIVQPEAHFTLKKRLSPAMHEEICEGSVAQTTFNVAETMLG